MEYADLHARPATPGGVRPTSVLAYRVDGAEAQRNGQAAMVLQVMRDALISEGVATFTCRELVARLCQVYPVVYWHPGNVSARLVDLKKTGQVVVCNTRRRCTISNSGRECEAVMLPMKQERLAL
jgi:hypothetical protein